MKNSLIFLLLVCFYQALGQNKLNQATEHQADKVCEMISQLPEIIKADNYCKKLSKGKRHLVTFIDGYPGGDDHSYLIKVAEDNGSSYHAWFLFVYKPGSKKVEFYDPAKDQYISLKKWRKNYRAYI